jgi:hypothetical protein
VIKVSSSEGCGRFTKSLDEIETRFPAEVDTTFKLSPSAQPFGVGNGSFETGTDQVTQDCGHMNLCSISTL